MFEDGNSYLGNHTFIELNNGDIIDPTIKQFRDGKYDEIKTKRKKYRGDEYYDMFMKDGSFFKTIRHRYTK